LLNQSLELAMKTVCLLTAGTGSRMGIYSNIINKTLLPIRDKAIISHIIEQFDSDTKFVIALGYKGSLVEAYLKLAHPQLNFEFVKVKDFDKPGAGPAQSLLTCRPNLTGPFMVIACDGYYSHLNSLPENRNILGVSRIEEAESLSYCNVVTDHLDNVTKIVDKQFCNSGLAANGIYAIKDTEIFWQHLSGTELSSGFKHIKMKAVGLPWTDLGTFERYKVFAGAGGKYDFSKPDEFIYLIGGRAIKFFNDPNVVGNRVKKTLGRPNLFPKIDYAIGQMYSYKLVPGDTLYFRNDVPTFRKLLGWLRTEVWLKPRTTKGKYTASGDFPRLTKANCEAFYFQKTNDRLSKFREKYPDFNPTVINGTKLKVDIDKALTLVDWDKLCSSDLPSRNKFIHGDLQFDNIIYDGSKFTLIDWRHDFDGETEFGDLYYDIAKLIGGMTINYSDIKNESFKFWMNGQEARYEFTSVQSHYEEMIKIIKELYPDPIIDQIVSLIFLNMSPLHNAPFDKMLFCIALERLNKLSSD
jgi:choline kinase